MFYSAAFAHNYEVEVNPELPGTGSWNMPVYYFPQNVNPVGHYMIVKIKTADRSWIGYFAEDGGSADGVWATPNPSVVLVVHSGKPYYVNVQNPETWEDINLDMIIKVTPLPAHNMILLNHWTSIIATDHNGLLWQTVRLVLDGLEIVSTAKGIITCQGDAYNGRTNPIKISAKDGSVLRGSVYPDNTWQTN